MTSIYQFSSPEYSTTFFTDYKEVEVEECHTVYDKLCVTENGIPLKVHKKVPVKATKKIPKQRCVHTDGYQEPGQPQVLGKLGSLLNTLKHKLLKHVTNKMKSVKVKNLLRQSS